MIYYDETVDRIRTASEPIKDGDWDFERELCELRLRPHGRGTVTVLGNADEEGGAVVSLELHGLTCEQAEALLHVLSRKPQEKVTYDIPGPEVGRAR